MNNPELEALDPDLREYYTQHYQTAYVAGVPIQIQLTRLLRRLLEQSHDGQDSANHSEQTQNDV
jgi:hypothetical protein